MVRYYLYSILIILFFRQLFAQEKPDTLRTQPGTAFYLELFGKPFYSLNVDLRLSESKRFSLGIQPVYGGIPNIMFYGIQGEKRNFEVGCGLSMIAESGDFHGLLIHGVIGYRYQKKKGLLFRAGFTPIIHPEGFLPMVGVSFGYSL